MGKVYITGLGAISPIGLSAAESFEAAVNGVLGIAKPQGFDSELTGIYAAGEVKGFSPEPLISRREAKRMPTTQLQKAEQRQCLQGAARLL